MGPNGLGAGTAVREFATIVLVVVSMLVLAATPYAFFAVWTLETAGPGGGLHDAWLTLAPAVAIILLWVIRASRRKRSPD